MDKDLEKYYEDLNRYLDEVRITCPDCGYFLLVGEDWLGEWSDECTECGWPQPDFVANG